MGRPKIEITYRDGDTVIHYVPRPNALLWPELTRVRKAINDALRILYHVKRVRHIVIASTRFQLSNAARDITEEDEPQVIADEIARLSYVMDTALRTLEELKHCRVKFLEEVRFTLKYGQTPKKRENSTMADGKAGKRG